MKTIVYICKAIGMVFAVWFLLFFAGILSSCQDRNYVLNARMQGKVDACEHVIDKLDSKFSFSDTVAETDMYLDMCQAKEDFEHAKTTEEKRKYYKRYIRCFDKVFDKSIMLMNQYAKEDTIELYKQKNY